MVHRFVGIYLSDQVLVFQRVDNTIYRVNHNLVHFVESYAVLITFCHFILIYLVNSITHPLIDQDRCWKSFVIINKLIAIDILFKETKPGLVFVSLHGDFCYAAFSLTFTSTPLTAKEFQGQEFNTVWQATLLRYDWIALPLNDINFAINTVTMIRHYHIFFIFIGSRAHQVTCK